tara:strand:- start:303 stop:542 length:240 start_codon:yes stop_codon:yes gene_type:complete
LIEGENKEYIKGFNHAYLLVKYKPELMKSIIQIQTTKNYFKGLQDGKLTFENSKTKSRYLDLERLHKSKEKNLEKGLER